MESKKINIIPKEKSEIKVVKKETTKLHEESISKVFYIEGKRIPFTHQKTLANCGPLAIANGVNALRGVNDKFNLSKEFPSSSQGIRKLLSSDPDLRRSYKGVELATEIEKDSCVLQGEHIANLIKKLAAESNIRIIVDRFSSAGLIPSGDFEKRVIGSDWLILHKNYHYTSFVKINNNDWISLDSMNNQPVEVNQKFIEDSFRDILPKVVPFFMAMKVEDAIKIILKENKIVITKKEKEHL